MSVELINGEWKDCFNYNFQLFYTKPIMFLVVTWLLFPEQMIQKRQSQPPGTNSLYQMSTGVTWSLDLLVVPDDFFQFAATEAQGSVVSPLWNVR